MKCWIYLGNGGLIKRRANLQTSRPTAQRVRSLFGHGFMTALFELKEGEWHGPVLSGYGTHLVYVNAREEFPAPALTEVKDRVTQDWVEKKRQEITEEYFKNLLARYEVVVTRGPVDGQVEAP